MRVAYLTSQYSTIKSGPGRFTQYLKEINNQELNFTFFSDDMSSSEANAIQVKKVKFLNKIPGYWLIKFYLFSLSFKKENTKNPFDIILTSSAYEAIFLKNISKKIPLYVMINDEKYMFAFKNFKSELKRNPLLKVLGRVIGFYTERSVIKKATCVVANSIYTKNLIAEQYKVPSHKLHLLYKAVDLNFFKFKSRGEIHKIRNFLFVKNDWRIGGLDIIIKAIAKLPWQSEINFTIVGVPESEHSNVRGISNAANYKGKLSIEGLVDREKLLDRLYHADLYILMSRKEALGVSLLEALSTGTPVVAANTGGIPEVLDFGKAGFIVPSEDSEALAATLEEINKNPEVLSSKIKHGVLHCEKFSKEALVKNLNKLLIKK